MGLKHARNVFNKGGKFLDITDNIVTKFTLPDGVRTATIHCGERRKLHLPVQ